MRKLCGISCFISLAVLAVIVDSYSNSLMNNHFLVSVSMITCLITFGLSAYKGGFFYTDD